MKKEFIKRIASIIVGILVVTIVLFAVYSLGQSSVNYKYYDQFKAMMSYYAYSGLDDSVMEDLYKQWYNHTSFNEIRVVDDMLVRVDCYQIDRAPEVQNIVSKL